LSTVHAQTINDDEKEDRTAFAGCWGVESFEPPAELAGTTSPDDTADKAADASDTEDTEDTDSAQPAKAATDDSDEKRPQNPRACRFLIEGVCGRTNPICD
jgi:hypothetical protein